MKTLKTLLVLAFVGLAGSASAQFANSGSGSGSIWTTVNTDGYNRIYFGYTGVNAKYSEDGYSESQKFPGFSVGYLRGIGLTQKLPLYLEVGGAIQFNRWSDTEDYGYGDVDLKQTLLGLNIPVSLVYRINVTDDFAISPNFGLNFRLNLLGKGKAEQDGESVDWNLFDDKEMEEADQGEAYKRFQAGWHIGVGFDYKAIHLGVDWGTDFNEITKNVNCKTTYVTLGYNF